MMIHKCFGLFRKMSAVSENCIRLIFWKQFYSILFFGIISESFRNYGGIQFSLPKKFGNFFLEGSFFRKLLFIDQKIWKEKKTK